MKRKPGGHPGRQDLETQRTYNLMKRCVELVRIMEPRLSEEAHLHLKASALGLMVTYSELTGLPSPLDILERTP